MTHRDVVAENLANALLVSEWTEPSMQSRASEALDGSPDWLPDLLRDILQAHPSPPKARTLRTLIRHSPRFCFTRDLSIGKLFWIPPSMQGRPDWPVPPLVTPTQLAEWLDVTVGQLGWFADCRAMEARSEDGPLRHYRYLWRESRSGKRRLLEAPRPRLKCIQRKILDEILVHLPAHDAAHAYLLGRSIVTFACPHVGRQVVLRMDLRDFFPSISVARVRAIFLSAGYPYEVARLLAGLCTNTTPDVVWPDGSDFQSRQRFRTAHLPQGAPTSPALANLCAFRLDKRLTGLARKSAATYTRYADDLAFSGDETLDRSAKRFRDAVAAIALDEGFLVNYRKTRIMPRSARQCLAGVVVNEKPNGRRAEYDRVEAILTNCVKHGAKGQNRAGASDFRAHLAGRIAHLARLNPARGQRLRELFARIDWAT